MSKPQTILARWRELRAHRVIAFVHYASLLFFFLSVAITLWRWKFLPPAVPLWYSRPWGEDQLAHPLWLFLLPVGALLWHGINIIVSASLLHEYPVFARVLFLSSLLVAA
ncbi:MAG: hypothetical protein AAB803_01845, partial [Patescibacteria group bacterium]